MTEILLRSEIAFGRLRRRLAKKQLDLRKLPAGADEPSAMFADAVIAR
jgi:hypothetical protein